MQSAVLFSAAAFLGVTSGALALGDNAAPSPEQFHLALAGTTGVSVSFKTNTSSPLTCSYGPHGTTNLVSSPSTVKGYFPGRGFYHHVLLPNLAPSTPYSYTCAGSPTFTFSSPPQPGVFSPMNVAVFGDWGYLGSKERGPSIPSGGLQTNWSAVPVRDLLETLKNNNSIDLVLHTGDISYSDDSFGEHPLEFTYEDIYDDWMNWIQNLSAVMPYHISPGNHESECHSPVCLLDLKNIGLHLNNFSAYKNRWNMNNNASGGVEGMWYSVTRGGVHFVSINTETDWEGAEEENTGDGHFKTLPAGHFGAPGQYMAWLEQDLEAAAADPTVRWIIASGHRPFEDLPSAHQAALVGLFKGKVAFYLCGHGHTVIRYDASAFGDGAVHIMPGAAGSDETKYPIDQLSMSFPTSTPAEQCQDWCSQRNASSCHFCTSPLGVSPVYTTDKLSVGRLQIEFDAITYTLLRAPDGMVLDTVTVTHPSLSKL